MSAAATSATYSAVLRCARWFALTRTNSFLASGDCISASSRLKSSANTSCSRPELHRLLAQQFERFVYLLQILPVHKRPRLESLLDFWILRGFSQLSVDVRGPLRALPHVAQHH